MRPWFPPAAITILLAYLLLLATFILVSRKSRDNPSLRWALGWFFLCLHLLGDTAIIWQGGSPLLSVASHLALAVGTILILTAALSLTSETDYSWHAALVFSLFALWTMSGAIFISVPFLFLLPISFFYAAILLGSAFVLFRHGGQGQSSPGIILLACALSLWGTETLASPFIAPRHILWAYVLDSGVIFCTGLAALLFLFERWEQKAHSYGERYRALFNGSRDALFVFHLTEHGLPDRLIETNETACRLLGYNRTELLRLAPKGLSAPELVGEGKELLKRLGREKNILFRWRLRHKTDGDLPVEIDARIVQLEGRPTLMAAARDIREQLRTDARLAESHQRLIRVLDSLEAMVYVADLESDEILYANRKVSQTYGDVVGLSSEQALRTTHGAAAEHLARKRLLARDGEPADPFTWETFSAATGKWYHLNDKAIRWLDGRLVRLEVATDITERKHAEKVLQRELAIRTALAMISEKLLAESIVLADIAKIIFSQAKTITGSAHGLVGFVDRDTKNLISTTFTEMMTRQGPAAATAKTLSFPLGADGRYPGLWGHALNTGRSFFSNDPTSHPAARGLPAGHLALSNFLAVPIRFDDEIVGQIALANSRDGYGEADLAAIERLGQIYALALHQEQTQKEKERLIGELRQSQKMEAIGTLAGGIAHDFNNTLYAILGYAELTLSDLPAESKAAANIREIIKGGKRAAELVAQILVFSRTLTEDKKKVALQFVIKETLKLLRGTLPTTIEIRENIDTRCRPVLADIMQIHQIIINLCTNAHHAMREKGGLLSIALAETVIDLNNAADYPGLATGDYLKLTVQDTGCGMTGQTLKRIFEPHFTTKAASGGTGLGLATVQAIVKDLGGGITVQSEPGLGTTFELLFPILAENDADQGEQPEAPFKKFPRFQARILFVDDELTIVNMARKILEKMGCTVKTYTSSVAALQAFASAPESYDLVISDQTMPELSGYDLACKLLAIRPGLPLILITGFSDSVTEAEVSKAGISAFLLKPLSVENLARAIGACLGENAAGSR
ncbi:GAF domain-containing protein [Thiovibrio sp. JS02]